MSAQASRNRDLEQQLQAYRTGGAAASPSAEQQPPPSAVGGASDADDVASLMLHEDVGDAFALGLGFGPRAAGGRGKFGGFELESVEEMEMDTDMRDVRDADQEMEKAAETSPSAGSADDDAGAGAEEEEEEERGRKGRDGRPAGVDAKGEAVKVKDEKEMETS